MIARLIFHSVILGCGALSLAAEEKPAAPKPAPAAEAKAVPTTDATEPKLSGSDLKDWKIITDMNGHGEVTLKEGVLTLGIGQPMTGVVWNGKAESLPVKDYEISFETQRVEGGDFFAALTVPVRDAKTNVTLVLGGWGGSCVGISNIQYQSANENDSTSWFEFQNNTWYKIRLQVRENSFICHIGDEKVFECDTTDRKLGMRFGEIELCTPLGFASYGSKGQIKNLALKKLPAAK